MDLNQITVAVRNLDEGLMFYRSLGLHLIVLNPDTRYARLELPSGSTTLSLHEQADVQPGSSTLYFEVKDVDRRYTELMAMGITFDGPPPLESWRWCEAWFPDPTGNRLCLYHAGSDRRFPPWRLDLRQA